MRFVLVCSHSSYLTAHPCRVLNIVQAVHPSAKVSGGKGTKATVGKVDDGKPLKQMQQGLGVSFVFYDSRDCPRGTRPDCKDVLAIVGDDAQIAAAIQR